MSIEREFIEEVIRRWQALQQKNWQPPNYYDAHIILEDGWWKVIVAGTSLHRCSTFKIAVQNWRGIDD
jgi:hypothetical protein